jgi:hypothetical protein
MTHFVRIASLCLILLAGTATYAQIPSAIDALKTRTFHVAVQNAVGCLSATAGLNIVELSQPGRPEALSTVVLPQSSNYARMAANLAYVAQGPAGVFVIDISDSRKPHIIGHISTPGSAMMLDLRGDLLAVACGSVGVALVDVSTPSSPQTTWWSGAPQYSGYVRAVRFYENRLFMCAGSAGVGIIEVDEAGQARPITRVRTAGDARDIDFYRNHAFVADGGAGVSVLQIAPGEDPSLEATYPTGDLAHGVAFHKGFVFVADGVMGVASFELTRDRRLKARPRLDTREGYANKVTVFDRKLFVANDFKGLLVFDIHSPGQPVLLE